MSRTLAMVAAAVIAGLLAMSASAERMTRIGAFEAHYSLVPTTLLSPAVAADYGIVRGRDRALLNVTVLNADGAPVQAGVSGVVRDLLGRPEALGFREVLEGEAVYYLAQIRHPDQEVLRFTIDIGTPDGASHQFSFQQKMYWEEP